MPANYFNAMVDPNAGIQQGINQLISIKGLQEEQKRTNIMERGQTIQDEKAALEKAGASVKFIQIKSSHIASIAKNLLGLPREQRAAKYMQLVNEVAPTPIGTHPEYGPLGVVDSDGYVDPDVFKSFTDEQQEKYLELIAFDADEIAKLRLEDKEAFNKAAQIEATHQGKRDEIILSGTQGRLTEKEKGRQQRLTAEEKGRQDRLTERLTAEEKGRQDRLTEEVKNKGKGSPGAKENQDRIDKYRKSIVDMESEILAIRQGKTDKLDKLGELFALASGKRLKVDSDGDNEKAKERAINAVEDYIKWVRKQLRKLELGAVGDDPLRLKK